jgi:hypothetical protein
MYARRPTPVKTQFGGGIVPSMPWLPGDSIVLRERWGDRIFEARPATVVSDEPHQVALFVRIGASVAVAIGDDGEQLRLPIGTWRLEPREVRSFSILSFAWPEIPYSVLFLREPDGNPRGWYVNLQTPLVRTPIGFDTVDHALDVLVAADRSSWKWKDEDELAEAVELGLFTPDDAAWFRYWGERGIEHLLLRQPPFDQDWESWLPDPSWPNAELPPGWDAV